MDVFGVIIGVALILVAIAIVAAVLLQSSKNARQSGVVSGAAESFFGKSKGKAIDRKLNRITLVLVVLFAGLVLTMYIIQPGRASADYGDAEGNLDDAFNATTTVTTTVKPTTTTVPATTTAATTVNPNDTAAPTDSAVPETNETPATTEGGADAE